MVIYCGLAVKDTLVWPFLNGKSRARTAQRAQTRDPAVDERIKGLP